MTHPLGYDAGLVRAVTSRGCSHTVANLIDSYWGACKFGRATDAAELAAQLAALIPPSHRFLGIHPRVPYGALVRLVVPCGGRRVLVRAAASGIEFVCRRECLEPLAYSLRLYCSDCGRWFDARFEGQVCPFCIEKMNA